MVYCSKEAPLTNYGLVVSLFGLAPEVSGSVTGLSGIVLFFYLEQFNANPDCIRNNAGPSYGKN